MSSLCFSASKPIINGKFPSGRGGATLVQVDGKFISFGGHFFLGEGKFEYLNETWVFDPENLVWHLINCKGELPMPRYGHSAHVVGSKMFIFGGKTNSGALLRDVWFLDMIDWVWIQVNPLSQGPSARMNHAAELIGRKIVVHGGWNGKEVFDDFWIFNTDSFGWSQPKTTGFAPSGRFGHTINLLQDGRLLVFGGCSIASLEGFPQYNNDIRQLDTETMIWTRPRINGEIPTARYGHIALVRPSDQSLIIMGGWGTGGCQSPEVIENPKVHSIHILDTSDMMWYSIPKRGKRPLRPLYNHAACLNEAGNMITAYGGFDGRQASAECIYIQFEEL